MSGATYTSLLKETLRITVAHKHLWVFGFFLSLFSYGAEGNALLASFWQLPQHILFIQEFGVGALLTNTLGVLASLAANPVLLWGTIVFLALVLSLVVYAQAGIVLGVIRAQKNREVSIASIIGAGAAHFWPLVWINILIKVVLLAALGVAVSLATLLGQAAPSLSTALIAGIVFAIGVFAYLALSFFHRLAVISVVSRGVNAGRAFAESAQLFRRSWLLCVELSVVLAVLQLFVFVIIVVLGILLTFPFALLATLLPGSVISILSFFVWLVVVLTSALILSWYSTFEFGSWAVLYSKVQSPSHQFLSFLTRKLSFRQ